MCGVVALVQTGDTPIPPAALDRMIESQRHRGPDDCGRAFSKDRRVALGFRRLSILDLTQAGHQPMISHDGRFAIVFNGEIYNYVELRRELKSSGHQFRSQTDTEVLLQAYVEWGPRCLERLIGMWAFVILEIATGHLFGSRDRFGVKPLYMYRGEKHLLFASEIKAIRASGLYDGGVDWTTAARFMVHEELDTAQTTFFDGIERLPAGHWFQHVPGEPVRVQPYWSLLSGPTLDARNPVEQFAELFDDAVRLRMRSDVPVGILLSGGLDSTSILCRATKILERQGAAPMHAFNFAPPEFDERVQVNDTITSTGAVLHSLELTPLRMWDALEPMLRSQDEPAHSMTAVAHFRLMQLAHDHGVKVVLVGQGADESLAGYGSYFDDYQQSLLRQWEISRLWRELGGYVALHGGGRGMILLDHFRRTLISWVARGSFYRSLRDKRNARRIAACTWFAPEIARAAGLPHEAPRRAHLRAKLAHSVEVEPLPLYLRVEDRNSMAHSVEARLPFMDHRLMSYAFQLADDWKIRGGWNKYILRESMRGSIPESVRGRPSKLGFPTPVDHWLRGPLRAKVAEVISDPSFRRRAIYNHTAVEAGFRQHVSGTANLGAQLFDVLQMEVWMQITERAPLVHTST